MDEIIAYNGNEDEFKKYRVKLNEALKYETSYYNVELTYRGQKINDKCEGIGILYNNKSGEIEYNGYFKEGKSEGYGKKYKNNKLIYEGFFNFFAGSSQFEGRGTLYEEGNIKYEGFFYLNKYEGIGIEYFPNGKKIRKMKYNYGYPAKESYGILYDDNNNEIYKGLLIEEKPKEAKSITIYYSSGYKKYSGDFSSFKYNGKGILYFQNNNKIFFEGIFKDNKYINGILYDLNGNKTYEGEFINNIPKEGKNIKLYELNGKLKYEGDILDCKYHGKGTLYNIDVNDKLYEGEFKKGIYDGYGKIYSGDYLYYEGNFKEGKIYGKGIKFYKNGNKKIEGIFDTINLCEGKYYDLNNKEIYNGKIINDIPYKAKYVTIYNDDGFKLYEGEINDTKYEGEGIEYSEFLRDIILYKGKFVNNYYIENIDNINNKLNSPLKIIFLSYDNSISGKTNLMYRLVGEEFNECSMDTIGVDMRFLEYYYNNNKFNIQLMDTGGEEYVFSLNMTLVKNCNIIIYVIDIVDNKGINEDFIKEIKKNLVIKHYFIYVVINRIDITRENLEKYREDAKKLILNGTINRYFETSGKTKEGVDILLKCLKIDSVICLNRLN